MGCCASDEMVPIDYAKNTPNNKEIDISHFDMEGVLGQGGFGVVRKAVKKTGDDFGQQYAIKCLIKKEVISRASGPISVLTELRALTVLDLSLGGDMRFNLKYSPQNRFEESVAKFFICQVLVALNFCHEANILHRDVKPENLLMKGSGYIMLTDFGIAKILPDIEDCRSTSGTHGYMAPEIYLPRHKHGTPAEWFAVGVTLHEFVTGRRPFDSSKIKACSAGLEYGKYLRLDFLHSCNYLSVQCKDFIENCLKVQPKSRLRLQEMKFHPWLLDFDWDGLEKGSIPAPSRPDTSINRSDLKAEDEMRIIEKQLNALQIPPEEQIKFEKYAFRNNIYKVVKRKTLSTLPENSKWTLSSEVKTEDKYLSDYLGSPSGEKPLKIVTDKKTLSMAARNRKMWAPAAPSQAHGSTSIIRNLGPVEIDGDSKQLPASRFASAPILHQPQPSLQAGAGAGGGDPMAACYRNLSNNSEEAKQQSSAVVGVGSSVASIKYSCNSELQRQSSSSSSSKYKKVSHSQSHSHGQSYKQPGAGNDSRKLFERNSASSASIVSEDTNNEDGSDAKKDDYPQNSSIIGMYLSPKLSQPREKGEEMRRSAIPRLQNELDSMETPPHTTKRRIGDVEVGVVEIEYNSPVP